MFYVISRKKIEIGGEYFVKLIPFTASLYSSIEGVSTKN